MTHRLSRLRSFLKRTDGTATVETVLWFPLFIAVFGLMLDVAMIFFGQAKVLRIAQEGNREYSIGRLTTPTEAEAYIEGALAALNIQATARTTEVAGVAHTLVTVQANQLQVLGYFTAFSGLQLNITAEHMIENWEV